MQTNHEQRKADAKAKRKIAHRMLKVNKSNAEIMEAIKAEFKTGIGPDVMAEIREELGTSGANRGAKKANANQKKQNYVLSLIKKGAKNADIREKVKAKFKTGIHNSDIAALRGTSNGRSKNGNSKIDQSVLVLQDNGTSAAFKETIQGVINQMSAERVQSLYIHADGTVRVQQNHEFFMSPQRAN